MVTKEGKDSFFFFFPSLQAEKVDICCFFRLERQKKEDSHGHIFLNFKKKKYELNKEKEKKGGKNFSSQRVCANERENRT